MHALRELPGWELVLLRTRPLIGRPAIPRDLADRVHVRTARDARLRAAIFNDAAIFVPGIAGLRRVDARGGRGGLRDRAPERRRGAARARSGGSRPPRRRRRAARARGRCGAAARREADVRRRRGASSTSCTRRSTTRRRTRRRQAEPLADRPWIVADLHMHTSWSHDCSTDPAELVDHAEAEGLGAIAVTDHNVFGGALEAVDCAEGRDLIVIPGEEVKTDGQGEVIGLFLQQEIPRGLSASPTRSRRSASRTGSSTSRTRSTGCTRSPTRRRSTGISRTSTCSRSTTRGSSSRRSTTRRSGSPASTT